MTIIKWLTSNPLYAIGTAITKWGALPPDFDAEFAEIYQACKPYTMTSPERMLALYKAVQYVLDAQVDGDFVECGVWRGGSSMLMAAGLQKMGVDDRNIYLYDTFAGMSEPGELDRDLLGNGARQQWRRSLDTDGRSSWCFGDLQDVKRNLTATGYPAERFRFVEGRVEQTIPGVLPERIALLRLDTDWFESTYHELVHLYPRLQPRGVLIIDDYGHWQGARAATDQYIAEQRLHILLNRIDYTGRLAIKT